MREGFRHHIALRAASAAGHRRWRRPRSGLPRCRRPRGSWRRHWPPAPRCRRSNRPAVPCARKAHWPPPPRHACGRWLHLVGDAEQVLHVVAHLMRDHIGLGEIAGRAELVLHVLVEGEVDVDLLVARAIERAHGRLRHAAGRLHEAGEQHELRLLVVAAHLLKISPQTRSVEPSTRATNSLPASESADGTLRVLAARRRSSSVTSVRLSGRVIWVSCAAAGHRHAAAIQHLQQVDAEDELEDEIDDDQEDDGLEAEAAAAAAHGNVDAPAAAGHAGKPKPPPWPRRSSMMS